MSAVLTLVTILQPLPHEGRGCLPCHLGEVGRQQVECLVVGLPSQQEERGIKVLSPLESAAN